MRDADWKTIAELVGITAIVLSLSFVGLQLMQSQVIAIATQYSVRSSEAREFFMARAEMPDQLRMLGLSHQDHLRVAESYREDMTLEEVGRNFLVARAYLAMYDNNHYQYEAGFVSDDAWAPFLNLIRETCIRNGFAFQILNSHPERYRPSFIGLCNRMRDEAGDP